MIKKDRAQSRQKLVDLWFARFVEHELYDDKDYHSFCKRVSKLNHFEIERLFNKENRLK